MNMLALAVAALTAPADEVPFRVGEDAIIVDVTVNGKKASMMFDTGFSGTAVIGEHLDIGKASGVMNLVDFVGSFQAKTVDIKSLKIGDHTVPATDKKVVQQPTDHFSLSYGAHCDGILGLEPFQGQVFQINFEKQKFVFLPDSYDVSQLKADGKKTFAIKMYPLGNGSVELPVELSSGKKLVLGLDTGNSHYATTHKDALEENGAWKEGRKADFMGQSWVASGPVDSFHLGLTNLKIFSVPVADCVFSVIDLPSSQADHHGTVGFGFLKNFNITLDLVRRRVFLENFTGKVSEEPDAHVGILAFPYLQTKKMRVFSVTPGGPADKAGIKRGDYLISIDGEECSLMAPRLVEARLKGTEGSKVKLDLSRDGQLVRAEVERKVLVNKAD